MNFIGILLLATSVVSAYTNSATKSLRYNKLGVNNKRIHIQPSTSIRMPTSKNAQEDPNNDSHNEDPSSMSSTIFKRFTSPRISDVGLPLADTLLAQVVAPSLQVFWLALNHAPSPTWLQPIFASKLLFQTRGSLVAPTLIHGAELACCWLAGALAAKGFESEAFDVSHNKGYIVVFERLVKAGAFAVGALVLSTQIDLFFEFGGR